MNLARNPATPLEALDTAARIEQSNGNGNAARDFTIQRVDAERIAGGDWTAINFLSPFLTAAYSAFLEDDPAAVPIVPLDQLAEVGPEGRRIRDAYTQQGLPTVAGRRALWHHDTNVTQSMSAQTDAYIEPKDRKEAMADRYWEQRSRLLLPHRLRLNRARVAAVILSEPAVGSIWTPCRPYDEGITKALCLYLNSTPGLLALLGGRGNRVPAYPSFSLDILRSIPIPNLSELDKTAIEHMTSWFGWLQNETLLPLPEIADDPVRVQIDAAVAQALGFDAGWITVIRRELAREPSVTDYRAEV